MLGRWGGLPKLHLFSWGGVGGVGGVGWGGGGGGGGGGGVITFQLLLYLLACYAHDPCPIACYVLPTPVLYLLSQMLLRQGGVGCNNVLTTLIF